MQNLAPESFYWRFENHELADPDIAFSLTLSLCDSCQLAYPNPELQLVLGEIIINAIDHGILNLGSELKDKPGGYDLYILERQKRLTLLTDDWISVTVERNAGNFIQISVQDSGSGFDHEGFDEQTQSETISLSGRGLMIVKSLCENVMHVGNGNCIVVEFDASVAASNDDQSQSYEAALAG